MEIHIIPTGKNMCSVEIAGNAWFSYEPELVAGQVHQTIGDELVLIKARIIGREIKAANKPAPAHDDSPVSQSERATTTSDVSPIGSAYSAANEDKCKTVQKYLKELQQLYENPSGNCYDDQAVMTAIWIHRDLRTPDPRKMSLTELLEQKGLRGAIDDKVLEYGNEIKRSVLGEEDSVLLADLYIEWLRNTREYDNHGNYWAYNEKAQILEKRFRKICPNLDFPHRTQPCVKEYRFKRD